MKVDPAVPHSHGSPAMERVLGTEGRVRARLVDGHGELVAGPCQGRPGRTALRLSF